MRGLAKIRITARRDVETLADDLTVFLESRGWEVIELSPVRPSPLENEVGLERCFLTAVKDESEVDDARD